MRFTMGKQLGEIDVSVEKREESLVPSLWASNF